MSQYPVAVVVGSLRRDSFNRKLANAVARLAPSPAHCAAVTGTYRPGSAYRMIGAAVADYAPTLRATRRRR